MLQHVPAELSWETRQPRWEMTGEFEWRIWILEIRVENLIILFLVQVMTGESSGEFQMYPCGRENLWYNSGMNPVIPANLHMPENFFLTRELTRKYDSPHPMVAALEPEFLKTFIDLTDTQRSSQANIAICNIELMSEWRYTEKQWKPGETYFHRGETALVQPFYTFKSPCGYKKLTCEFNNLLAFECELKHGVIEKILKILDPIPW